MNVDILSGKLLVKYDLGNNKLRQKILKKEMYFIFLKNDSSRKKH